MLREAFQEITIDKLCIAPVDELPRIAPLNKAFQSNPRSFQGKHPKGTLQTITKVNLMKHSIEFYKASLEEIVGEAPKRSFPEKHP